MGRGAMKEAGGCKRDKEVGRDEGEERRRVKGEKQMGVSQEGGSSQEGGVSSEEGGKRSGTTVEGGGQDG